MYERPQLSQHIRVGTIGAFQRLIAVGHSVFPIEPTRVEESSQSESLRGPQNVLSVHIAFFLRREPLHLSSPKN